MNTKTNIISSEQKLITILQKEIKKLKNKEIKIIAGHLPLLYFEEKNSKREAKLGLKRWGEFSVHSFELGCKLVRYALDLGKKATIIVIVDDLVEVPKDFEGHRKVKSWMKDSQRRFYKNEGMPKEYIKIMKQYGVQNNILKQKRSFGDSELISEWKLKSKALELGQSAKNECSLAYNALLNDTHYFQEEKDFLISFIPGQCKGNICAGVIDVRDDLHSIHVFFPHIEMMGGIIDSEAGFIEFGEKMTLKEMYDNGHVTYVKTK
jgi:hypothetical protein